MKRKASLMDSKRSFITPWLTPKDKKGDVDTSTPEALLQCLLGNTKKEEFFSDFWEKKPLHVSRGDEAFYGEIFTLSVVNNVLTTNEFKFLLDVNAFTYADGQKNEFIEENYAEVTSGAVDRLLHDKKASLEFAHPQRYIDDLWNIVEKLESYFGSLWNANAYFTPSGRQGSPPHCDDVENFILQTEGRCEWKLYTPMVELSRDFTQDVSEDSLGEPMKVVMLEPGDMLYFPRGVIYQCKATEQGHSTHVVLSTYQENARGDFMIHAVQQALETAMEKDVRIRAGLPINFRSYLGTARNMGAYVAETEKEEGCKDVVEAVTSNLNDQRVLDFKEEIKKQLSNLVDHIDVNKSADAMCTDFMTSRLPPYGHVAQLDLSTTTPRKETVKVSIAEDVTEGEETVVTIAETTATTETTEATEITTMETTETTTEIGDREPVATIEITTTETTADVTDVTKDTTDVTDVTKDTMSLTDHIRIKYPDHVRVVFVNGDDDDDDDWSDVTSQTDSQVDDDDMEGDDAKEGADLEDEDEEDAYAVDSDEPHIEIQHSLHNDRFNHMGFALYSTTGKMNFDVSYAKALVTLRNKGSEYLRVDELSVDSDDVLSFVSKLNAEGLLDVKTNNGVE